MPVKPKHSKKTSSIIPDTSNVLEIDRAEEQKRIQNKKQDIQMILLMIQEIENNERIYAPEKMWKKLAGITDKITRYAADPDSIRNIYGNVENDGICWQDIYHIKAIITHKLHVISAVIRDLSVDLPLLKNKLLFILKTQRDFISNNFEQTEIAEFTKLIATASETIGPRLEQIEITVSREYNQLIINKILEEVRVNEGEVTFSGRENRYFFARKFTIIGELVNQLKESGRHLEPISSFLVLSLNEIIKLRDKLVHNNKRLISLDSAEEDEVADNIKILFKNIEVTITSGSREQAKLKQVASKIYSSLIESTITAQPQAILDESSVIVQASVAAGYKKKKTKEKIEETLDKFIAKICSDIERVAKDINELNGEYVRRISQLPPEIRSGFPENILTGTSQLQIKDINVENKRKIQDKLIEEENIRIAEAKVQELKDIAERPNKVIAYLKQIEDEYKYLITLEASMISDVRKAYIYEHAINVIGALMEEIRNKAPKEISEAIGSMASNTFKAAQSNSIYLRKNGLSHDIFSFSSQKFDQLTSDEVLSAHDDVRSITYILSAQKVVISSVRTMKNVATSYLRLGLYAEAIKVLLEAKEHIETHPEEINEEKLESCGLSALSGKVRYMDLDQVMLGVDSYAYEISDILAIAYILNGSIEEANTVLQNLLGKIDYEEVNGSSNKFHNSLSSTISTLAKNFYRSGNIEQAVSLYKQAYQLTFDDQLRYSIELGLMECLTAQGNDNEATKIRARLSANKDELCVFMFKMKECMEHVESEKISEAKILLNKMNEFLVVNKGILKNYIGDRFFLLSLMIIDVKLRIFDNEAERIKPQLKSIENEFNEKLKSIPYNLQNTPELENTYIFFSISYLKFSSYVKDRGISNGLDEFQHAKQYTTKAIAIASGIKVEAAQQLAIVYSNFGSSHQNALALEMDISALETARVVERAYNIHNERTSLNYAITTFNLAERDYADKKFDDAYSCYQEAINIAKTLTKTRSEPANLRIQGACYERLWEYYQDINFLKKARVLYKLFLSTASPQHPDYSEILSCEAKCEHRVDYSVRFDRFEIIEQKVIEAFSAMKAGVSLLRIYGKIDKSALKEYCNLRLGREDIAIKPLLGKQKGFMFTIDDSISHSLNALIETKSPVKVGGIAGLFCIDASMDYEYIKYNEEAFEKFGSALAVVSREFSESHDGLRALEDEISSTSQIDYSSIAFSVQQGFRFLPTVHYFFKIYGIDLPKINPSSEIKASVDFALGLIKINPSAPDNYLIPGQMLESSSYYAGLKTVEILQAMPTIQQPTDLASLIKTCKLELSNGLVAGISLVSPTYMVYGLISGAAQCIEKHQLFKEETDSQTIVRHIANTAVGLVTLLTPSGSFLTKAMDIMSKVVITDIGTKVAFVGIEVGLNGVGSDAIINNDDTA